MKEKVRALFSKCVTFATAKKKNVPVTWLLKTHRDSGKKKKRTALGNVMEIEYIESSHPQ